MKFTTDTSKVDLILVLSLRENHDGSVSVIAKNLNGGMNERTKTKVLITFEDGMFYRDTHATISGIKIDEEGRILERYR